MNALDKTVYIDRVKILFDRAGFGFFAAIIGAILVISVLEKFVNQDHLYIWFTALMAMIVPTVGWTSTWTTTTVMSKPWSTLAPTSQTKTATGAWSCPHRWLKVKACVPSAPSATTASSSTLRLAPAASSLIYSPRSSRSTCRWYSAINNVFVMNPEARLASPRILRAGVR